MTKAKRPEDIDEEAFKAWLVLVDKIGDDVTSKIRMEAVYERGYLDGKAVTETALTAERQLADELAGAMKLVLELEKAWHYETRSTEGGEAFEQMATALSRHAEQRGGRDGKA